MRKVPVFAKYLAEFPDDQLSDTSAAASVKLWKSEEFSRFFLMDPYKGGNGMDPNRLKHIEDHVAKLHPSPTAETRYKDKQGLAKYVELLDKNTQVKPSTPPRQTDGDSTSFGAALKRIKTT